jgi:hypothetical protein
VWKNTPLPSISVGHSDGWAYVAAVEHGWRLESMLKQGIVVSSQMRLT